MIQRSMFYKKKKKMFTSGLIRFATTSLSKKIKQKTKQKKKTIHGAKRH